MQFIFVIPVVVDRFWQLSRSRHVSGHWRLHFSANEPSSHTSFGHKKKSSGIFLSPHLIKYHSPGSTTQPELCDSSGRQYSVQGSILEPPKALTRRSSKVCYSCAAYSKTTRSPLFTDPAMPLDHPHVLNVITPLYQCELLCIVANISAWRSQQSSDAIWAVTKRS